MFDRLPPEVILEILHRLPIEALVKCTAVCKSWNSIIKSPTFISTHLERSISSNNSTDTNLLLFRVRAVGKPGSGFVEQYSLRFDNEYVDEYKQLHFPFSNRCANYCFRVAGSCNGLVCLADDMSCYVYTIILWNPIIQKAVLVPTPSVTFGSHGPFDAFLGFGFDSKTNDYKLLRFVELENCSYPREGEASVEVEIYSLNANCWKSITDIAPKYGLRLHYERLYGHSFVNGAIHLLACDWNRSRQFRHLVLAFDVSEEVFNEIALPECLSNDHLFKPELVRFGQSSIAVMSSNGLWVMKEYGVATSWTKVLDKAGERVQRVLAFRNNEEAFVTNHRECIASHDMKSKHFEFFGVQSPGGYSFIDSFVESLVLLDYGKHASGALLDVSDEGPKDDASSGDDSDE